jgi:hypothetical protein
MRTILPAILGLLTAGANAQPRTYSTANLASGDHQAIQCDVSLGRTGGKQAIQLAPTGSAAAQQMLLLKDANFSTGTIEFEVFAAASSRFIGLAWHVESEQSYEAVYFRPFRFRDTDPVGKRHAVQYVSHPKYPWNRLRAEFPDVYESACPVDPEQWLKVKIEVQPRVTRVYVEGVNKPIITVDRPFPVNGRGVALWTGNATRGSFANVTIKGANSASAPPTKPKPKPNPNPATKTKARTTAFAISAAEGEPVNLLTSINPQRNAMVGDWTMSSAGLEVKPKPFAQIVIPQDLPKSYDIDLTFTRNGPIAESVTVLLPVGPKGVAVQFAAQGKHDGIGLIDGTPSWLGPATRSTSVKTGQRMKASIRVRQQGTRIRIAQYVNGDPHVSWEGPTNQLSLYQAFKIPSGKAGLAAFNNNTIFHSVILKSAN